MFYVRGNPWDYDRWEVEMGNPTWNWKNALKYFKKSERNQNKELVNGQNKEFHSDKGPQIIDDYGELHPLSKVYIDAGKEHGIKYVEDINANEFLGYTNVQGFVFNGRRQSTAKSFLIPAMNRSNLNIVKHAYVQKVVINNDNTVTGVEFVYKDKHTIKINVKKEVILSAGAVNSPQILMQSGIGPAQHLKKYNIEVKKDLSVGQNLFDHIYAAIYFRFDTSNTSKTNPHEILQSVFDFAIYNKGLFTNLGPTQLTAMINSENGTGYPDVQLIFFMYPKNSWEIQVHLKMANLDAAISRSLSEENAKSDIGIIWITLLQPKSVGYIELKSASPNEKPRIVPNYFNDDADMTTMLRAVKQQISFTETNAYRKLNGDFLKLPLKECDNFEFKSDKYLRCYIQHFSGTLYHPVGTSKMGPKTDPSSVVDHRLKVYGINGLRQVDAGMYVSSMSFNA